MTSHFAPPRDLIALEADDAVLALAARLWERAPAGATGDAIRFLVRTRRAAGAPEERDVAWEHETSRFTMTMGAHLRVAIALEEAAIAAEVSEALLARPALAARYLLEAPAAALMTRRAHTVLHAAAVVGSAGAVVLRGAPGAGKSTLAAAAWKAGLAVLADESLLAARADADDLAATVRDLALRADAVRLLGLERATEPAFSGGEAKRRVDLWSGSSPAVRRARRAATILLGPREPGPARLVALAPRDFTAEFAKGAIPQEGLGEPGLVARSWGAARSWRLDGASDIAGAVAIVKALANAEEAAA